MHAITVFNLCQYFFIFFKVKKMGSRHTFARNFRMARVRRGLTQEEVARHCKVNTSAVSHWESGRSMPKSGEQFDRVCEILGIDVWRLFRDDDEREEKCII
jgi:transcriptional regulator with XRE-family HTH domain